MKGKIKKIRASTTINTAIRYNTGIKVTVHVETDQNIEIEILHNINIH